MTNGGSLMKLRLSRDALAACPGAPPPGRRGRALACAVRVQARGLSPFGAFGYKDSRGRPYSDMCGVVGTETYSNVDPTCGQPGGSCRYLLVEGDCMQELSTQIITYLVAIPVLEVRKHVHTLRIVRRLRSRHLRLRSRHLRLRSRHLSPPPPAIRPPRQVFKTLAVPWLLKRYQQLVGLREKAQEVAHDTAKQSAVAIKTRKTQLASGAAPVSALVAPTAAAAAKAKAKANQAERTAAVAARRSSAVAAATAVDQTAASKQQADEERERAAMIERISEELLLPRFTGTFDEFNTKVVQFGCVTDCH